MNKSFKIITVLLILISGLITVWFSLDKTTRCSFIYGRNICNFYAMMDINSSIESFDEKMNLCSGMDGVPKRDGCFELIAETFIRIDANKSREACNQVQGFRGVHSKGECLNRAENFEIFKTEEE